MPTKNTDNAQLNKINMKIKKQWLRAKSQLEKGNASKFFVESKKIIDLLTQGQIASGPNRRLIRLIGAEPFSPEAQNMIFAIKDDITSYINRLDHDDPEAALLTTIRAQEVNFFLDCYFDSSRDTRDIERDSAQATTLRGHQSIYIAIMERMQKLAPPHLQKKVHFKLTRLKNSESDGSIPNRETIIDSILGCQDLSERDAVNKYYKKEYASFHFFSAKPEKNIKPQYIGLRGDSLKAAIISDFTAKIRDDNSTDKQQCYNQFIKSDEYEILKKGQGIWTSFFGFFGLIKTTSVSAVESIYQDAVKDVGLT